MTNVINVDLKKDENRTVDDVLQKGLRVDLVDALLIGENQDGTIYLSTSGLKIPDALYFLEKAKQMILEQDN